MASSRKSGSHGQSGDPRKRAGDGQDRRHAAATPELEDAVAAALMTGHPIDMVMLASSLVAGLDPGERAPDAELPEPTEFVRMFVDSTEPGLRVLGWTVARLLPQRRLQAEVDAALGANVVPSWLRPLAAAEVVAACQTTDPLCDSTDIVVSLRIGEADLSVIGLIDFNSCGALKDAFAVPTPLAAVRDALDGSGAAGMRTRDLDAADARAWLAEAITVGRSISPPFESDSWPHARPLLEWTLRLCPEGGDGWDRTVWTRKDVEAVVSDFAESDEGAAIADPRDRAVLMDALVLLAAETSGDPLLISAVKLEMGLGYLWPTGLDHDWDRVVTLPTLLRPFVRWAHTRRTIPAEDTEQALAVLAHRRAEFVRDVEQAYGSGGDAS